jgi:hypothetical protein
MSTFAEKIADSMLGDQGVAIIWKPHADAATLFRVGNFVAAGSFIEIAEAAEREWLRQAGHTIETSMGRKLESAVSLGQEPAVTAQQTPCMTAEREAMLKIRLLKGSHVVGTVDAKWTINIADIAHQAGELEPRHGADDWEIVNETDTPILTKSRWNNMNANVVPSGRR